MAFLASCLLIASVLTGQAVAVSPQQILADLSSTLSSDSQVVVATDPSYPTDFTRRWTIFSKADPTYVVGAKPATAEDVQKIVQYASKNKISFLATGGGHGYTTSLGGLKNGIDVDLSNFKKIVVDGPANTMVVGAANTFADMYEPLYAAGKMMPSGGSSTPGIIGATLGGGIGPLTGEHGLFIDSLLSVEMVTGSGQIVTASATQRPDLYWGMRGAGVNFGVVLSATYRVYDTINNGMVYNADISFEAEKNASIFEILKTYEGTQDDKLAISLAASLTDNVPSIDVSAIYFGTKEQGEAAIKSFLDQKPFYSNISVVPYNQLVYVANFAGDAFARQKGIQADMWGYQLNTLSVSGLVDTYNRFFGFLLANPDVSTARWLLEKFGLGVTATIPDDSTAYPWREAVSYGFFMYNLPANVTAAQTAKVDTFAKKLRADLMSSCGNPEGNVFNNYARGIEKPEQVYGKNKLPRLRILKKKYDPKNLFRHYNSFT